MEFNKYPEEYDVKISPAEKQIAKICNVGSSKGVVISKRILEYMDLEVGDTVHIWVKRANNDNSE